ncbi:hypothetical protein EDD15DRAFT_2160529, partial [Pisolithus albus]
AASPIPRECPSSTVDDAAELVTQVHARHLSHFNFGIETGHVVIVPALTRYRPLEL